MASENRVRWSVKGFPIYELVAKFPLPILVKTASSPKGDSGIEAHETYKIKRLIQIQTIIAQVIPESEDSSGRPLTLSIPQDYRAPFQILPFEPDMYREVSLKDVVKYKPRYIEVVEKVSNITSGVKIELNPGNELEVLGTRIRATMTGVQYYLKLRKEYRDFVINPDCSGKFKVIADTTEYNIFDILQRCSLPQKVALVEPAKHSNVLLGFFPTTEISTVTFMLKDAVQDEYIIGEDSQKINGIVLHTDIDMYFYVPDSVDPSYVAKEELKQSQGRSGTQDEEEINVNQFICKQGDKPVMRGPIDILFRNLVLPPRSHTQKSVLQSQPSSSEGGPDEGIYGNVELRIGKSRQEQFGKIGTDDSSLLTAQERLPPIPPRSPGVKDDRLKLMTPIETQDFATGTHLESGPRDFAPNEATNESDYDDPESESDSDDNQLVTSQDNYEIVEPNRDDEFESDPDTGPYEEIDDVMIYTPGSTQVLNTYLRMTQQPEDSSNESDYLQPIREQTTADEEYQYDVPPPLPSKTYDRPRSLPRRPGDPKYCQGPQTGLPEVYRKSVHGVERPPLPSTYLECPPEPLPRRESAKTLTVSELGSSPQRRQQKTTLLQSAPHQIKITKTTGEDEQKLEPQTEKVSDPPDIISQESLMANPQSGSNASSLPTTEELKNLSEDGIADVLKALNFSSDVQQKFKASGVDGELFCTLDSDILKDEFSLSEFHTRKILKFINGWRPQTPKVLPKL